MLSGHRFPPRRSRSRRSRADGRIDLDALAEACRRARARPWSRCRGPTTRPACVQPVAEAATIVHAGGGSSSCDAVQLAGRVDSACEALGADVLALSGPQVRRHEGGGRADRGATSKSASARRCCAAAGRSAASARAPRTSPRSPASARRRGRRAGTATRRPGSPRCATGSGAASARLRRTPSFRRRGASACQHALLRRSRRRGGDADDRARSRGRGGQSGSACSSGKVTPSHVLAAMGVAPDLAAGAIRLSFGWASREDRRRPLRRRILRSSGGPAPPPRRRLKRSRRCENGCATAPRCIDKYGSRRRPDAATRGGVDGSFALHRIGRRADAPARHSRRRANDPSSASRPLRRDPSGRHRRPSAMENNKKKKKKKKGFKSKFVAGVENSSAACRARLRGEHVQLMRAVFQLELRQHNRRALKTVGFDNIGTGREIRAMDIQHPFRMRAAQIFIAVFETRAAVIGERGVVALRESFGASERSR